MESVLNGANGYRFGAVVMQMQIEVARQAISGTDPGTGNFILVDGTEFDPGYYAQRNPDVVEVYGTQPEALLAHWLFFGSDEKRPPSVPRLVAEESFDESQEEETEYHPENNDVAGDDGGSSSSSNSGGGGGSSSSSSSGGGGGSTNTPTSSQAYYDSSNGPAITLAGGATGEYSGGVLHVTTGDPTIELPFTVTDTSTGTSTQITSLNNVDFTPGSTGEAVQTIGGGVVVKKLASGQYEVDGTPWDSAAANGLYQTGSDGKEYICVAKGPVERFYSVETGAEHQLLP